MYSVGIDIGGTTIKFGVVDDNNEIILRRTLKTNNPQEVKPLAIETQEMLNEKNIKLTEVDKIVVGIPGIVNVETGASTSSVLGWYDFKLKEELEKEINLPVEVFNDVNLATMAEVKFGGAKGYSDVVMLTLGTGVGGGIVIDNKLCLGNKGMGAEIGHTLFEYNGRTCNCGRKGCFQAYASATALIEQAKEKLEKNKTSSLYFAVGGDYEKLNGEVILREYKNGDKTTIEIVEQYIEYLSEGVVSVCNFLRPQIILLGGGISNWGEELATKVKEHCKKQNYGYLNSPEVEIKIATLKNDAGILGCKAV